MNGYIKQPQKIPFLLRLIIWFTERKLGKKMLVARLLSWYPKTAISSGIMESLVAHKDRTITERMLKLIRMQVSFKASCPFCIDMNSAEYKNLSISQEELESLQGLRDIEEIETFTRKEKILLKYTLSLTETPVSISKPLLDDMVREFSEREMVIIISTIAQVNVGTGAKLQEITGMKLQTPA